jgi:hypothetical protein
MRTPPNYGMIQKATSSQIYLLIESFSLSSGQLQSQVKLKKKLTPTAPVTFFLPACVQPIDNLAYLHRPSNEYRIAVKASLSELLVATNRDQTQIVRAGKPHSTTTTPLLDRTFSLVLLLLCPCEILPFVNTTQFLRRPGRRELRRPRRVPWHKVQTACACLVEEHGEAGR